MTLTSKLSAFNLVHRIEIHQMESFYDVKSHQHITSQLKAYLRQSVSVYGTDEGVTECVTITF